MNANILLLGLGGLAALAAFTTTAQGQAAPDGDVRADLQALSRRTIFFGHQSVGANILDGVRELAAGEGVAVRIDEVARADQAPPGTWAHGYLAENGDPLRKLSSFERALGESAGPDLALMKFCYVDFTEATDAQALFARYRTALAELRAKHPRTTFVHVTAPLTAPATGPRAAARRLLGRRGPELQNVQREAFNELLRGAYAGREPLFDLARAESTRPDGQRETFAWNGRSVPALVPAYTDDGGHLNAEGRRRVARQLVAYLASLPPPRDASAGAN